MLKTMPERPAPGPGLYLADGELVLVEESGEVWSVDAASPTSPLRRVWARVEEARE